MRTRALLLAALLAATPVAGQLPSAVAAGERRPVAYRSFDGGAELRSGNGNDVVVTDGALRLRDPSRRVTVEGTRYASGQWTSPWVSPGFTYTEVVPSWDAETPEGTFVAVQVRTRTGAGTVGSWDKLSRWTLFDTAMDRTSFGPQSDDFARVATDTVIAQGTLESYQLRVILHRRAGSSADPSVDGIGAMASRVPSSTGVATSTPAAARGTVLDVPRFSQMTHEGHWRKYGGGGEAWCSPTSLAMVLGYYDALPRRRTTAWAGDHPDRVVDHVARMTYDYGYQGTGNWSFNTAYAATRVHDAFVTRFRSLRGVERFVAAGIPVTVSVTFGRGQLDGAPISSTNGHLLVVVGFTSRGDVVVNDPAASRNEGVRRTYARGQLEDAWLKRGSSGGSGGIGYVVRDRAHPLPDRDGARNW